MTCWASCIDKLEYQFGKEFKIQVWNWLYVMYWLAPIELEEIPQKWQQKSSLWQIKPGNFIKCQPEQKKEEKKNKSVQELNILTQMMRHGKQVGKLFWNIKKE